MGKGTEAASGPLRLRCAVQNYDWGRSGGESTVARLFERNSGAEVDLGRPYAEFWIGTHESGPSFVEVDGLGTEAVTLKKWIGMNPGVLGEKVEAKWGRDLPFLFKVLSVAKALSIQAHPDKELARMLHEMRPNVYKDPNHKPEMAIALTEFKALCGFVGVEELKNVLTCVPEITELVGNEEASKIISAKNLDGDLNTMALLKSIFTKLMSTSKEAVANLVSKLKGRLDVENKIRALTEKEQLVLLLEKQYQADVGVIAAFFFNYLRLNPGEALYIGPNEPHAYLSGECIECMAASDNVVRAGLTPKYIDVQTLCSMLTYKQGFPEIIRGVPLNPYVTRYTAPFDEFEVDHCLLQPKESVVFPAIPGPSIFLVVAGEGKMHMASGVEEQKIAKGDVYFVPWIFFPCFLWCCLCQSVDLVESVHVSTDHEYVVFTQEDLILKNDGNERRELITVLIWGMCSLQCLLPSYCMNRIGCICGTANGNETSLCSRNRCIEFPGNDLCILREAVLQPTKHQACRNRPSCLPKTCCRLGRYSDCKHMPESKLNA